MRTLLVGFGVCCLFADQRSQLGIAKIVAQIVKINVIDQCSIQQIVLCHSLQHARTLGACMANTLKYVEALFSAHLHHKRSKRNEHAATITSAGTMHGDRRSGSGVQIDRCIGQLKQRKTMIRHHRVAPCQQMQLSERLTLAGL